MLISWSRGLDLATKVVTFSLEYSTITAFDVYTNERDAVWSDQ